MEKIVFKTFVEGEKTIVTDNFEVGMETKVEQGADVHIIFLKTLTGKYILYSNIDKDTISAMYERVQAHVENTVAGMSTSKVIDMATI